VTRLLKQLGPQVLGVLVRRGACFAAAEDAVQEAMIEATRRWPTKEPNDPKGWLVTVAWRRYVDAQRSDTARRDREARLETEPPQGPTEQADDALVLLFLCCHPALTPASAIALTLRAVGGLTTRQIAEAYLVPEATMAQRISRAKRTIGAQDVGPTGDLRTVLHVLYLIFNAGYTGEVDLAAEAIRLTRQLATASDEPEVAGLLALMLLHHARRDARWADDGALVTLDEQDRTRWDTRAIAEGVGLLRSALASDRLGEYQAQAAIAALHADAPTADETDWPQILEWYDELLDLTGSDVVALNRVVAVGQVDGPLAGLRSLERVPDDVPRHTAVRAHLHERAGDAALARELYLRAARAATSAAERDHLTRRAARLNAATRGHGS
jgi:RNA polymerase sigma factor (sigma-70 family)